jgi:adenosylhomocysteinase
MGYTLEDTKLRVSRHQSRDSLLLPKARLIILEHILPTTEEFIVLLQESGAEIFSLLAKPYSINEEVFSRLQKRGVSLERKSYEELETTDFLDRLLMGALEKSRGDGRSVVIVDVGGYFAEPLMRLTEQDQAYFSGVVEDTTFGHNRYIEHVKDIHIPVFSVARSALKEIEARFVGRDAVAAVDHILRIQGVSLPGRNALVIGYGMIGKNVARTLMASDLKVFVYDLYDLKNLAAFIDGYHIHTKDELLKLADIIYCATGDPKGALSFDEIEDCKDNVILVSVGSKDTEFDVKGVQRHATSNELIGSDLVKYKLHNSKVVYIAKGGTAVNFILPSIPVEVLDLVFSEILYCILVLLESRESFPPGRIHDVRDEHLSLIAKRWLRFVNR